jgi:secreted PhoX family phosphatase
MQRRVFLSTLSLTALIHGLARSQTTNPQAPWGGDKVSSHYNRIVIARWGDAILPGAPAFAPNSLTIDQASTQFPYDAVIAGLITPPPAQDGSPRLVMVLVTPDAPAAQIFADGVDHPAIAGRMQGATVMNLQYAGGRWVIIEGGYQSRRLGDNTLCQISGPAAAVIGSTVQGVLAPQAGCATPWSTALLAEGNAGPWLTRLATLDYGFGDPADAPRFGWVTELNPLDPDSFPVKRTALGRFTRHGIAATVTADGKPVIFMSAAASGFLFRFVAASNTTDGTALDSGTLSVARLDRGSLSWEPLGQDAATLAGPEGPAEAAGATAFDGPAGIAIGTGGVLYLACQGEDPGSNGSIWQLTAAGGDLAAAKFAAAPLLTAGRAGTYAPGSTAWFRKPGTLNLDAQGQLWIGTNQGGAVTETADGFFLMPTSGPATLSVSLAYLAPIGGAAGGAAFDPASQTSFAMVRHPGAVAGATFATPATRWPQMLPSLPPQTTLIGLVTA